MLTDLCCVAGALVGDKIYMDGGYLAWRRPLKGGGEAPQDLSEYFNVHCDFVPGRTTNFPRF